MRRDVVSDIAKKVHDEADEVILAALAAGVPMTEIRLLEPPRGMRAPNIVGYMIALGGHIECCRVKLWY